ncbi:MAG: acetyl-CoA carboxylase biotin carboxyl carrier protein [Cyanobacteria bacterium J06642_11]
MDLDFSELRQLVAALDQTDIAELTLKNPQFELTLRKATAPSQAVVVASEASVPTAAISSLTTPPPAAPAPAAPPPATAEPAAPPAVASDLTEITSPMVGTFYRSPAPDEAPFVDTGDRIKVGQTVCIIEAMKLMNELEAEISGEIVEILVQNAEPVEFGQPLMRVRQS